MWLSLGAKHEFSGVGDYDRRAGTVLLVRRDFGNSLDYLVSAYDTSKDDVFASREMRMSASANIGCEVVPTIQVRAITEGNEELRIVGV